MKLVRIHCEDEIDRVEYIPFNKVERICINADGSDYVFMGGEAYLCYNGNFYESITKKQFTGVDF